MSTERMTAEEFARAEDQVTFDDDTRAGWAERLLVEVRRAREAEAVLTREAEEMRARLAQDEDGAAHWTAVARRAALEEAIAVAEEVPQCFLGPGQTAATLRAHIVDALRALSPSVPEQEGVRGTLTFMPCSVEGDDDNGGAIGHSKKSGKWWFTLSGLFDSEADALKVKALLDGVARMVKP